MRVRLRTYHSGYGMCQGEAMDRPVSAHLQSAQHFAQSPAMLESAHAYKARCCNGTYFQNSRCLRCSFWLRLYDRNASETEACANWMRCVHVLSPWRNLLQVGARHMHGTTNRTAHTVRPKIMHKATALTDQRQVDVSTLHTQLCHLNPRDSPKSGPCVIVSVSGFADDNYAYATRRRRPVQLVK